MLDSPASGHVSLLRKLVHLGGALIPAIGWYVSHLLALALAGTFLGASLAVEAARHWWPWVNQWLWRLVPSVFRAWEDRRVLGSTWYAVGILVALLFYGPDVGGTAVLFLAWGDPAAELVGRRWGDGHDSKTVVGSLGCLAACLLAGTVGVFLGGLVPWAVLAGAVAATLVERWSPPPDDNLWIPIISGLAILLVQSMASVLDPILAVRLMSNLLQC